MPDHPRHRPTSILHGSQAFDHGEDDDDLDFADRLSKSASTTRNGPKGHRLGKDEAVVSFGGNGAEKRERSPSPAGPKVIPMIANLDWREDRKKRLGLHDRAREMGSLSSMKAAGSSSDMGPSPRDSELHRKGLDEPDRINDEKQKIGLQTRSKRQSSTGDEAETLEPMRDVTPPAAEARAETPPPETAEQAAIRALLSGDGIDSSSATRPDLVIPQYDEKEVLQNDVETRPEAPSLADYAATPVDQFGAALLRGMGWKEGMGAGRNGKGPRTAAEPKKRAALLGLGARERAVEPLPGSSSGRKSPPRPERRYVPVTKDSASSSHEGSHDSKSRTRHDGGRQGSPRPRDRSHSPPKNHESRRRSPDGRSSARHENSRSSHREEGRGDRHDRRREDGGDKERSRRERDWRDDHRGEERRSEHGSLRRQGRDSRDRSPDGRQRRYDE